MVRKELEDLGVGTNRTFIAIYHKGGKRYKRNNQTYMDVCFKLVVDEQSATLVTDHIWVNFKMKDVLKLNIKNGNIVTFTGTITSYGDGETGVNKGKIINVRRG